MLKDREGNVIDRKTAPLGGSVELSVWGYWIVVNGRIEVYSGSTLLVSRTFDVILGGDVYRVIGS